MVVEKRTARLLDYRGVCFKSDEHRFLSELPACGWLAGWLDAPPSLASPGSALFVLPHSAVCITIWSPATHYGAVFSPTAPSWLVTLKTEGGAPNCKDCSTPVWKDKEYDHEPQDCLRKSECRPYACSSRAHQLHHSLEYHAHKNGFSLHLLPQLNCNG